MTTGNGGYVTRAELAANMRAMEATLEGIRGDIKDIHDDVRALTARRYVPVPSVATLLVIATAISPAVYMAVQVLMK